MEDKPLAYIHIGLEKTGTTTLQEFAYQNSALLAEDNIYYPESPGIRNHTNLPAYAYDQNLNDLAERKNITNPNDRIYFRSAFEEKFKKEIAPIRAKNMNLLVSSEHLSSRVGDETEIRKLMTLFTDFGYQPKIIIYLRRQDELVLSTYSTWVKCGATQPLSLGAYKKRRYDYLAQLKLWENTVGKKHIIVGIFDSQRLLNGDLIQDFCDKINIDPSRYILPTTQMNRSLSAKQLEFLKEFNASVPETIEGEKNDFRGEIIKALESVPGDKKATLPAKTVAEIQAYFQAANEDIRARYFPEQKEPLFPPPIYPKGKETAQKMTIEDFLEISVELWKFQQNRINKLSQTFRDQHRYIGKLEEEIKQYKRKLL